MTEYGNEERLTLKIICFGDSVTRGVSYYGGRLHIVKGNYPSHLQTLLQGYPLKIVNQGVFNDNSDLLVARLDKAVLGQHPDYVLIEIGGNDCNFHWDKVASAPDESHEPIVPLERYLDNVTKMVQRIRQAGVKPIVMNLLPLDPVRYYARIYEINGPGIAHWIAWCGGIEHWHGMYNRRLVQLISHLEVPTIDVRTPFKRTADFSELLSDDGIHPTVKGYHVMAGVIASALPQLVGLGEQA